jgi:two-component system sensor histidine kinase/response regulator
VSDGEDASPAIASSAPVFDPRALELLQRLGGDKLVADIIDLFGSSAPDLLSRARAGVESGDSEAIRRALHSLKSSAGQLGAGRMQQSCEEGELLAAHGAGLALTCLVFRLDAEFADARVYLDDVKRNLHEGVEG